VDGNVAPFSRRYRWRPPPSPFAAVSGCFIADRGPALAALAAVLAAVLWTVMRRLVLAA